MLKKIKIALLTLRLKCLCWRIRRRDARSKWFEFRTGTLVRRYYFLNSLRKDLKNDK